MTETHVVETPKQRKLRIKLPTRTTVRNGLVLTGAFVLGAVVGAKRVKDACECDVSTSDIVTPDNN